MLSGILVSMPSFSLAGVFDSKTVVGSRLKYLTHRLERVASGELEDTPIPARPSSLSFVDSHQAGSMESSHTSAHTTNESQTSGRHGSSSSPAPVFLDITVGATSGCGNGSTPPSVDSEFPRDQFGIITLS